MIQQITLKGGAVVEVNLDREETCRSCGESIWWAVTKNGKSMPISIVHESERKGHYFESHFANCKQANQWRKKQCKN